MTASWPAACPDDPKGIADRFETIKEIVANIRNIRNDKGLSPKEPLPVMVSAQHRFDHSMDSVARKLANISELTDVDEKPEIAVVFMVGTAEFHVPMANHINVDQELAKLEEALKYQQGFLRTVMAKLGNEKFVNGAPEKVVAAERKKKQDAEARISAICKSIEALKK